MHGRECDFLILCCLDVSGRSESFETKWKTVVCVNLVEDSSRKDGLISKKIKIFEET